MPISSIQATIAKLSIRPPSATDLALETTSGLEDQVNSFLPDLDSLENIQSLQDPFADTQPPTSLSPPLASPPLSPPPPNGLDISSPSPPTVNNQPVLDPGPSVSPPPASSSSSLQLLASLSAEAFSMEGGGRGKQRVTKQSFLQPADGQGLHGSRTNQDDDPLSSLDPLWNLNKR